MILSWLGTRLILISRPQSQSKNVCFGEIVSGVISLVLVSLIAAMDRNRLIGNKNQLPWHLPADLKHFKSVTMGKPILMGRKTYESIGKPLPGRQNFVMTRSPDLVIEGVTVVQTFDSVKEALLGADEVIVIGGSAVYKLLFPRINRMYLTYVEGEFKGDAWFPAFDEKQWNVVDTETIEADDKNKFACRFVTYERI